MNKNITVKPFIYTRPSIFSVSVRILILLALQFLMLIFTKSYDAVNVVIAATLGALGAASLNYLIFNEEPYNVLTIIIQGLMFGLLLPQSFPPTVAFFISFFTLFISRCMIFQSINSWINVTAVAVIIAWFVGRSYFPPFLVSTDLVAIKNPTVALISQGLFPVYNFDIAVTNFLNSTVLKLFKVSIPEGLISILWDSHSTIPAFRFNILTIISSVVIFCDKAYSGIIPSIFLLTYGILVRMFCPLVFGGEFNQGDIILALLSSGTLFCAVFMIQWYGTTPVTKSGKLIFGFISGILAFAIMGCGTSPVGMVYTLLILSIINMIIRLIE